MRILFWLLTLAALAIGIALLGRLSEGYVLWVLPPWRVELSFNLYAILQLAVLLLAYLLLRGIAITLDMPRVVSDYRSRRAQARQMRSATEALRQFWEGRYAQAVRSAENVGDAGEVAETASKETATGVATLVAMKSAHALRDTRRIAEWRARAQQLGADWRVARLLAEMRIALDGHDFSAARSAFEQLGPKERRQISVQRLALRLAQGMGDWAELLRLVRLLEKHHALTAEQARPLRLRAQRGMLDNLQDDPAHLMCYWQAMPTEERRDPQLAIRAAHALALAGACGECARLVEDYLDEEWESALLEDYAVCPGGDVLGRIAHCEKWLHQHPEDATLLLALGRLCARRQLWGKAQSYLEASLAVSPGSTAHFELARLFDQLGRSEDANRHYRAAANCQEAASQSRGGKKSL